MCRLIEVFFMFSCYIVPYGVTRLLHRVTPCYTSLHCVTPRYTVLHRITRCYAIRCDSKCAGSSWHNAACDSICAGYARHMSTTCILDHSYWNIFDPHERIQGSQTRTPMEQNCSNAGTAQSSNPFIEIYPNTP